MNINFKLLHTFLLVAEHGSFRAAAEQANRSQSAMSVQIRRLEEQLGVALFHRTTRKTELTREGQLLLKHAKNAVQALEVGLRQVRDAAQSQQSHLSLACAPTIAATRLPAIIAAFCEENRGVTVDLQEHASAEMIDAIRAGEVDFGIGARVVEGSDLHFRTVMTEDICALIPANLLPPGLNGSITLQALSKFPAIVVTGSSALEATMKEAQRISGITLDIRYEVRQVQTQMAMARAGLGAAVLPLIAAAHIDDPTLCCMPIVEPVVAREICIVTMRGHRLPAVSKKFIAFLSQQIAKAQ